MQGDDRPRSVLAVERHGPVVRVVLDRPAAMNALDPELVAALGQALSELREDPTVRALVLAGAGGNFCAGSDVKAMATRPWRGDLHGAELAAARAAERTRLTDAFAIVVQLAELPSPTVAALRGAVAGGGLALATACDLRVGSTTTRASTAYARLGLPGDWGLTLLLGELLGRQPTRRLLLRGTPVPADEAAAIGLVDELVDDDVLDGHALALAADLAAGPTGAYREMKRLLLAPGLRDRIAAEIDATLRCQETRDHLEGLRSLLDRRPPTFPGS
jgi:2-(1,2-epoxy-1,2-dihydrophenyl)acetyl-CoA isomerase